LNGENIHGKNDFSNIFNNLSKYRSENNFVDSPKELCRKFKRDETILDEKNSFDRINLI